MVAKKKTPRMIEERGGHYRVVWRLAGVKQYVTVATLPEAKSVRGLVESKSRQVTATQIYDAMNPQPTGATVTTWCERYVASVSGIAEATRREYRRIIKDHIAGTRLGRTPLSSLDREAVGLWVIEQERSGLAPKSIANHHSVLSAAITDANARGLITANPCRGIRLPRRDDHLTLETQIYLTPTEVRMIGARLPDWCAHVPMLLADTGLRWSELTALCVGDVDVLGHTITVGKAWKRQAEGGRKIGAPKSQRSRRIVAPGDDALDILAELVSGRAASEWVVTSKDGHSPLPRSTFMRHWTAALYGNGTMTKPDGGLVGEGMLEKRPHIHSLRHTHASWLISHGASPAVVQAQLGHEDISTTMRIYAHLMPNARDDVRAALRRAKTPTRPVAAAQESAV